MIVALEDFLACQQIPNSDNIKGEKKLNIVSKIPPYFLVAKMLTFLLYAG
jgi:hypothetical protein